ncbi:unnamed protein product, partial [Staurois parvus]
MGSFTKRSTSCACAVVHPGCGQWAPGSHSWMPTLKMPVRERKGSRWKQDTTGPRNQVGWRSRFFFTVEPGGRPGILNTVAGIPDQTLHIHSIRCADIFPHFFWGGEKKCVLWSEKYSIYFP